MVSTFTDTCAQTQITAKETARETAREIAQQMSQECVARRLRQVNRTITRLYDQALRPYGLTVNQLNILAVVISEKQIRPGQLGHALGMEKSTVSRTVDRMVSKGWLKAIAGEDSRTQLLSVTAKGTQLLLSVTDIWDALQAGVLTNSDGGNLLQMLAVGPVDLALEEADDDGPISADDFYL
jgi:DNA-binding MarR family transcriptional regulator